MAGYGITDGVTLTDTQTLTNKTLTAPILNTEVTGTGVTTTGEANKLVKMSSVGNINMTQSVDGNVGMVLNNTSSGVNANAGFQAKGDNINYLSAWCYGSGRTGTIFGKTMGSYSALLAQGSDNKGLLLGTLSNGHLIIGTNDVERMRIASNGKVTIGTDYTAPTLDNEVATKKYVDDNSGGVSYTTQSKSSTYTALITDDCIFCTNTWTLSLPAANTWTKPLTVKNIGAGIITIDANGSETIDGELTIILTEQMYVVLMSDGTNIYRIGG